MPDSILRPSSLRVRLMWAFFLLTSLMLVVQSIALFSVGEEQEEDLIDGVLNTGLDSVTIHRNAPVSVALGQRMSFFHAPIGEIPAGLPESIARLPVGNHEWFIGKSEYHVGVRDYEGERFYLLYDETEHEERLSFLRWVLISGGVALSLLSLGLGHWFSRALLRQLEQLAMRLNGEDAGQLNRPGLDREVAVLARALDDYRVRNARLLAREREFTANVSHELRTPLSRIRTSAELLADGIDDGQRAQRIILAVDDLEQRLKGLLLLARSTAAPEIQVVALHGLVDGLLEPYRAMCQSRSVVLENRVTPQDCVDADPALLSLLLDNLLRNAVRYTESGAISVGFEDGWLVLTDTGIGIPEVQQAKVFERHFRVSGTQDGAGLGLAIVREITECCNWRCELHSQVGKGTEVCVQLRKH